MQCMRFQVVARENSDHCKLVQLQEGCHACDKMGCWRSNTDCTFYGRPRICDSAKPIVVPVSFCYSLHGVCVKIGDCNLAVGSASINGCNCLIDATYQVLLATNNNVLLPPAASVRDALVATFRNESSSLVTEHSFLEFRAHLPFILQYLDHYNRSRDNPCNISLQDLRAVCVSKESGIVGDQIGEGQVAIHYLNSGQLHFDPLLPINESRRTRGAGARDTGVSTAASCFRGYPRLCPDTPDGASNAKSSTDTGFLDSVSSNIQATMAEGASSHPGHPPPPAPNNFPPKAPFLIPSL